MAYLGVIARSPKATVAISILNSLGTEEISVPTVQYVCIGGGGGGNQAYIYIADYIAVVNLAVAINMAVVLIVVAAVVMAVVFFVVP